MVIGGIQRARSEFGRNLLPGMLPWSKCGPDMKACKLLVLLVSPPGFEPGTY